MPEKIAKHLNKAGFPLSQRIRKQKGGQNRQVGCDPHPLFGVQRLLGNRFVQRLSEPVRHDPAMYIQTQRDIQRDEPAGEEERAGTAPGELRLPDFRLDLPGIPGDRERRFHRMLNLIPPLRNPLESGDVNHFNLSLLPLSPGAGILFQPRAPWLPPSTSRTGAGATASKPSVPGSVTLFSVGPAKFRIVFEEPGIELPEFARESEERFRGVMTGEPPRRYNTGDMIKGLIKNFLTQTPPGQQILRRMGGLLGGGEEGAPSVHLNLDLLPGPVLEGHPPAFSVGIEAHW